MAIGVSTSCNAAMGGSSNLKFTFAQTEPSTHDNARPLAEQETILFCVEYEAVDQASSHIGLLVEHVLHMT